MASIANCFRLRRLNSKSTFRRRSRSLIEASAIIPVSIQAKYVLYVKIDITVQCTRRGNFHRETEQKKRNIGLPIKRPSNLTFFTFVYTSHSLLSTRKQKRLLVFAAVFCFDRLIEHQIQKRYSLSSVSVFCSLSLTEKLPIFCSRERTKHGNKIGERETCNNEVSHICS